MKVVSITPGAEELILLRVDAERYRLLKALSAETRVRIADIVQHASTNGWNQNKPITRKYGSGAN